MLLGVDMREADPSGKESYYILKTKIQKRGKLKRLFTLGLCAPMNGNKYLFYK
jgi:hypothetical protein